MRPRRPNARPLAPLLVGLLGCAPGPALPPPTVAGTVTFQGRPLAGGLVVFAPDVDRGPPAPAQQATLAEDGSFSLGVPGGPAVAPGWYRVAIAEPPGVFTEEYGYPRFPPALRRPDRSGLRREVKAGHENVFTFAVEVR